MSTLKTRLQLRYDELANWKKNNPVLLKGEIAIVVVPAESEEVEQEPAILVKFGDGVKKFDQLEYISAKAGDIYNWAKQANKPSYAASEITGLSEYVKANQNDVDHKYKITLTDHTLKLQVDDGAGGAYTDQDSVTIPSYDDTKVKSDISALQTTVAGKQDKITFNTAYDATTNKAATMKDVQAATADLSGAMHWRGEVDSKPTDGTGYKSGDVVTATDTNIEYAWDGSKWVELGNESSHHTHTNLTDLNKITGAKITSWDTAVTDVATLKTQMTTHTHDVKDLKQTEVLILDCGDSAELTI